MGNGFISCVYVARPSLRHEFLLAVAVPQQPFVDFLTDDILQTPGWRLRYDSEK